MHGNEIRPYPSQAAELVAETRAGIEPNREPPSASGRVFWITGLSASGKTTIASQLYDRLRASGHAAVLLDGDMLRQTIGEDLGHSVDDRRRSAMRNARICRMLSAQGIDVVCATISLFHQVHQWNRANIQNYHEIFLRVPIEELIRRDPKGLYARAGRGDLLNVVGLDVPAEEPERPDLIIDNHGTQDPVAAVDLIWDRLCRGPIEKLPIGAGHIGFGTKAETLERLCPILQSARVLPQLRFTVAEWIGNPEQIRQHLAAEPWGRRPLIIRSSARNEDGTAASQAGKYQSIGNVCGDAEIDTAIERVIASFHPMCPDDQVFVQPMLTSVSKAGVAFSRDPNSGGPYLVINYDDRSGRTDVVTSGSAGDLKTFIGLRSHPDGVPLSLKAVAELVTELERLLEHGQLDVEFAFDGNGELYLLQVRPLVTRAAATVSTEAVDQAVGEIARKVGLLTRPHPYLHGRRSVFGVMPDWNPAEIIGLKPRPLALSLYRELITDAIWAYQRDNYGYKNLRSFPLLISLHGLPYIDVRVSFNSFVPRDITGTLADRLVNYYIDRLLAEPDLHDKVEFEIIFSCYTLDLPERLAVLAQYGFSSEDRDTITTSLQRLTNRIINGTNGLWRQDRDKIDILAERLIVLSEARIDTIGRIYWLLEDCKRYGTLPFAGLARAGFIAVQLLRSLVAAGVLDDSEYATFMADLDTVGSRIGRDFVRLEKSDFLRRYGHLRPGTYDILSPRYDEQPDLYFSWSTPHAKEPVHPRFVLSVDQLRHIERLLKQHHLEQDVLGLIEFIKAGIEGREFAKFVFTRSLSETLSLIRRLGDEHGLSLDDCSMLDVAAVRSLYNDSGSVSGRLRDSVAEGRHRYLMTRNIVLPPVITEPDDVFAFHLPQTQPNFITQQSVTAPVSSIEDPPDRLEGTILFIPSADPGFDWIFTRGIVGFVTKFGGVNSHMAIRAGELGVPAVIGAGEALFQRWRVARVLRIDCVNRQVQYVE